MASDGREDGAPLVFGRLLFANISVRLRFGPIISHLVQVWRSVERYCNSSCRWRLYSPIFNNNDLLMGGGRITFPQWENGGIHPISVYKGSLAPDTSTRQGIEEGFPRARAGF